MKTRESFRSFDLHYFDSGQNVLLTIVSNYNLTYLLEMPSQSSYPDIVRYPKLIA